MVNIEKPTYCEIKKKENNRFIDITADDIFVIDSYKEDFTFEKISKLLVNRTLKNSYDEIISSIQESKTKLVNQLAKLSKLKKQDIEEKIKEDFSHEGEFLDILLSLEPKIDGNVDFPINDYKYKIIFDDKTLEFIRDEEIFNSIQEYTNKYIELIDESEIFEKNVFTHNNAANVGKELNKNNFFKANHKISFSNGEDIKNKSELDRFIQKEKDAILSNAELREIFEKIDSNLDKNNETREFKKIISNHPDIIPKLIHIANFKKEIWISILNSKKNEYDELIDKYKKGKDDIKEIIVSAKEEEPRWKDVVKLFNERFYVPFEIRVVNQEDVILKDDIPTVEFVIIMKKK